VQITQVQKGPGEVIKDNDIKIEPQILLLVFESNSECKVIKNKTLMIKEICSRLPFLVNR